MKYERKLTMVEKLLIIAVLLILAALLLPLAGCTQKHVTVTLPEIMDDDGTVRVPQQTVEYKETNFFSEDKAEGLWFQYDEDGLLVEFNKVVTTMESAQKLIEFVLSKFTPVPVTAAP